MLTRVEKYTKSKICPNNVFFFMYIRGYFKISVFEISKLDFLKITDKLT